MVCAIICCVPCCVSPLKGTCSFALGKLGDLIPSPTLPALHPFLYPCLFPSASHLPSPWFSGRPMRLHFWSSLTTVTAVEPSAFMPIREKPPQPVLMCTATREWWCFLRLYCVCSRGTGCYLSSSLFLPFGGGFYSSPLFGGGLCSSPLFQAVHPIPHFR